MAKKLSRTKWRGSWYLRKGKNPRNRVRKPSWRNRNTGVVVDGGAGGPRLSRRLGYEPTGASPYALNPRNASQAEKDMRTYGVSVVRRRRRR